MIHVREFTIHTDQYAHYKAIQERMNRPRPVAPKIVVAEDPELPSDTREKLTPDARNRRHLKAPPAPTHTHTYPVLAELMMKFVEVYTPNHVPRDVEAEAFRAKAHAKRIVQAVANAHEVTVADLMGPRRHSEFVRARWEAIARVYVAFPDWSLPKVGRFFNRDHTSTLHAVRKMGVHRS